MECGQHQKAPCLLHGTAQARDAHRRTQDELRGEVAKRDDDIGVDDLGLRTQIRSARLDLVRLRIAVRGRSTLEHVRDEDILALEASVLEVVGCPIVREEDGLAKSSRNTYLSAEERAAALCLSRAIFKAKEMIEGGERNSARVAQAVTETIEEEPLARIDYVEVVNLGNMQPVETLPERGLVAIAVYIGSTRLIDNYLYDFE